MVKQDEINGRIVPSAASESKNQTPGANPGVSPSNENQKSNPTVAPNNQARPSPAETQPFLFRTERVEDPDLVRELQAANVEYAAARPGIISQLLFGWVLPILFMVGIWTFLTRRLSPSGESIFSIGKSRARLVADPDTGVTFDHVSGPAHAPFYLQHVLRFLNNPQQHADLR